MDEQNELKIMIDGDMAMRKGAYANLSMARTSNKETILDFAMVDSVADDGTQTGVLQSRVIMSNDAFIEFAQMIANHFDKNFKKGEIDE